MSALSQGTSNGKHGNKKTLKGNATSAMTVIRKQQTKGQTISNLSLWNDHSMPSHFDKGSVDISCAHLVGKWNYRSVILLFPI